MRPHVELVDIRDLLWHPAELPHGNGEAEQQNLCYDEEDGSASLRVRFNTEWTRPAGLHKAFTEWFVLEGEVQLGDQTLTKNDYWATPKGVLCPELKVKAGTIILLFREYSDWTFTPGDSNGPEARDFDVLTVASSDGQLVDWYTDNASVEMKGDPVNWGEGHEGTEPPEFVLPTRSKSVGPMKRYDYM